MDTDEAERLLFVCFPDAGEAAGRYRAWRDPRISVHVVELPGRGERREEHPYRDMWLLVESLAAELAAVLARPHVLFGAGLGALVAYRLAQRRVAAGLGVPRALVVAHQAPPDRAARAVPEQAARADVSLLASDAHVPVAPPLPCPIRGFGEPHVMAGWGEHTNAGFVLAPARVRESGAVLRDAVLRAGYLVSALAVPGRGESPM
ncbi:thioesterase domain-containing protein [Amycolatopsis mongoliensis]|uniref:Thioesterase domain-containing protein n=1 Tax=Amycolatopsis mongoliensis TaxID=715475 RepID=A0A9Y2JQV4_9PSEU|nr:thioesterase domain-containing protein [Amycolatopsis sp. 4-36]WIY03086.1 thioesterase domain-containing protein [Amycolatopsis sp. 4-36]